MVMLNPQFSHGLSEQPTKPQERWQQLSGQNQGQQSQQRYQEVAPLAMKGLPRGSL